MTSLFRVRLAVLRDEFPISYLVGLVVLAVTTVFGDPLLGPTPLRGSVPTGR